MSAFYPIQLEESRTNSANAIDECHFPGPRRGSERQASVKNFLHQRPKKTRDSQRNRRPLTSPAVRPPPPQPQHCRRNHLCHHLIFPQHNAPLNTVLRPREALRRLERRLEEEDNDCGDNSSGNTEPQPPTLLSPPAAVNMLRYKTRSLCLRHADYRDWQRERPHSQQLSTLSARISSTSSSKPDSLHLDSAISSLQRQPQTQQEQHSSPSTPPPPPLPPPPPAPQPPLELRPAVMRCKTARTCYIPVLRDPQPPPAPSQQAVPERPPSLGCQDNGGIIRSSLQSCVGGRGEARFRRPFPLPSCLAVELASSSR